MFWGVKVNKNWRKRYNKESMPMYGESDILSFIRIKSVELDWIC